MYLWICRVNISECICLNGQQHILFSREVGLKLVWTDGLLMNVMFPPQCLCIDEPSDLFVCLCSRWAVCLLFGFCLRSHVKRQDSAAMFSVKLCCPFEHENTDRLWKSQHCCSASKMYRWSFLILKGKLQLSSLSQWIFHIIETLKHPNSVFLFCLM